MCIQCGFNVSLTDSRDAICYHLLKSLFVVYQLYTLPSPQNFWLNFTLLDILFAMLIRMEYQTRIENTASSIRTILNRMEEIELVDENGLTWQSDFSLAALMKHNLTETKNCEVDDEGIRSWMEQKKRILDVCEEISLKESQLKFQLVNLDDFLQDEKGYMENKQNKKKMIDDLKEKLCFLKEKPPVSCATD